MAGHDMSQMAPVPAPDTLPTPLHLTGIGNGHLKISASPEAQQWFDQGLNLLHDFWDYESARAFEQSIRVDPNCAICYWGLSQSLNGHGFQATYGPQALDHARSPRVPRRQRRAPHHRSHRPPSSAQPSPARNPPAMTRRNRPP